MASKSERNEAIPRGARTEPGSEYEVRRFEPDDRGEFCSLYESVFGGSATTKWFDWKYAENPSVDSVPIVLAERNDRIVGARPFFALEMAAGDRSVLALQPGDTMVHPEHRRQGLFSRMTEAAIDLYADREPAFFFNFPNERSRPGYLDMGWRLVSETPIHYRVQNPVGTLDLPAGNRIGEALEELSRPIVAGALDAVERFAGVETADITVERRSSVLGAELAALYRADVPKRIHARRSECFYEWRFTNPRWSYRTYLARRDGEVVGSAVVGSGREGGGTVRRLVDVLPMDEAVGTAAEGEGEEGRGERRNVLASLLGAVIVDSEDADLLAVHRGVFDHDVLAGFGFLPDDSFPLARLCSPTTLVVRSVGTEGWTLGEGNLTDAGDWLVSFAECDTA
jgi:GNAT superfamily N-acetyltransferase